MPKDKLKYQDLENQIVELKKQNEILRLQSSIKNEEETDWYYNTIINNIGDPVFVKDKQSRLLIVNDSFLKMIGFSRPDVIGKTLAEVVPTDERESFLKIDKQVIADGVENINEETFTIGDNKTLIISTRKRRFIDSEGKKFLVGVIHDITELKKAEEALKESEKKLKELNATKDKFCSIIAHDLRTPFNSILGFSELLIENTKDSEVAESKIYSEIINSSAKNTLVLLDNLLNWAKSQTGQIKFNPKKLNLSSIIQEILDIYISTAKIKNISLNYIPSEDIEVYIDQNMLKTVLRNLISNSIKFTNLNGKITINATQNHNNIEITVSDNGIGMNEETKKKLFKIDTNITTPGTASETGTGLGLILCKEFIEKQGGEIWVESELGKGSDFKFTFPLNSL
jgi:PAS domain S-box-containing protein